MKCQAIVTSKLSYPNIKEALNALKLNIPIVMLDNDSIPEGTIKFAELAGDLNTDIDVLKTVRRNADDVAVLPFSSGTAGFPKGVVLTHRSVVAGNRMIANPEIVAIKETTGESSHIFLFSRCFGIISVNYARYKQF